MGPVVSLRGILDLATFSWRPLPDPPTGKGLDGYVRNVAEKTFIGGHLYDPRTREWTRIPPPPWSERDGQLALTNATTIFVWGGNTADMNTADGYLLNP